MTLEKNVLEDFHLLANYLEKEGRVEDVDKYKKDFSAFLLHAQHLKSYDFVAPFCKDKKVLDIGCFIGYGEEHIFNAKEIVAIDSDIKALEFARQNRNITNAEFKQIDTRKLPFSGEVFDVVIAFQLIEHIRPTEIGIFLSEVKRVLKERGLFFVTTPNRKFRLLFLQRPFNPEHYRELAAKGLFKPLKEIFKDVQIAGVRANDWIEKIERKRVRKSPCQVYIYDPLYVFLNKSLPVGIKDSIKKIRSKLTKSSMVLKGEENDIEQFKNLFSKFSMDNFYLESHDLNKSLSLFAICKK